MEKIKNTYLPHLDLLRGVAIVLVVLGHVFLRMPSPRHILFDVIYGVHLALFVFISGALASRIRITDLKAYGHVIFKKFQQLFIPFISLPLAYCVIKGIDLSVYLHEFYHAGFWFLPMLFEVFVIFLTFLLIDHHLNKRNKVWISLILGGGSFVVALGIGKILSLYPIIQNTLSWTEVTWLYKYFLLGYFAFRVRHHWEPLLNKPLISGSIIICYLVLIYLGVHGVEILRGIPATIFGIFTFYWLGLHFSKSKSRGNSILEYLGKNSLAIYIVHYFTLLPPAEWAALYGTNTREQGLFWIDLLAGSVSTVTSIILALAIIHILRSSSILAFLCFGEKAKRTKFE